MIFFLDESCNMKMYRALQAAFGEHEFLRSGVDLPKGMDDIPLLAEVGRRGCNVFVTDDIAQLRNDRVEERRACRRAGLHWIGIPRVPTTGKRAMTADASVLIGALLHIVDDIKVSTEPRYYLLRHGPRNLREAIDSTDEL